MKRRGKGEGSVSFHKPSGMWQGQVELPRGVDGKRRRKTIYKPTQAEVVKEQKRLGVQADEGTLVVSATPTVEQWLRHWLKRGLKANGTPWAPKTKEVYQWHCDTYLIPFFGKYKLEKLSSLVIEDWADRQKEQAGRPRVTIKRALEVLRSALTAARRKKLVVANQVSDVSVEQAKRKPIRVLDATQAAAFIATIATHRLHALFLVALSCGLRFGEAIGLQWQYVNLDTGIVEIRQQLQWLDNGTVPVLRPLKTEKSRRDLVLPAVLLTALRTYRTRQLRERLKAGGTWQQTVLMDTDEGRVAVANDLVFTTWRAGRRGHPLRLQSTLLVLDALLKEADCPALRFHELRHSAVSLALAAGVPIEQIQQMVGHARIGTTTDVYGHLQRQTAIQWAGRWDAGLLSGQAKP